MSTSTGAEVDGHDSRTRGVDLTAFAAIATGGAFLTEAVISVAVNSHIGYHTLNVLLSSALFVAAVSIARSGRRRMGTAGVVGGWGTAAMASLAGLGGLWTLLAEGLASTETPGVVDGISHTAVLVSILFMVPLGLGLRRSAATAGAVIALAAGFLVAMVLGGLDSPSAFLAPEAALGVGWLLYGRTMRTESATNQPRR